MTLLRVRAIRMRCACGRVFEAKSRNSKQCPRCRENKYQARLQDKRTRKVKMAVRYQAPRRPIEFAQDFLLALPELRREYLRQTANTDMPNHRYESVNLGELPSFRK
jgi:predicted  nucleic acid-binding Zn-ribbon protein